MLTNRIQDLLKKEIGSDDLTEEASDIIKIAIEKNDTDLLDEFFGPSAYKNYLTDAEITQLNKDLKEKKIPQDEGVYKYFNSVYLRLGFYYACKKGNVKVAKYFMENQHLPGDLNVSVAKEQQFLESESEMKGPPLRLAVESGNLKLVKFIYENSDATIEETVGQPIESTPLMKACEADNEEMVSYLLEKGGNPNAEKFASWRSTTPLTIAIAAGNPHIIQLLVVNGAIVSNEEVNLAISKNLDLPTIELLLLHSVNHENPYHPYLLSAIQSGNISLLKALENNSSFVKGLEEIAAYHEEPIAKRMLIAAAKSGSVEMMRYLVEERNLNLQQYLNDEFRYFEKSLDNESVRKIQESSNTILYSAACNYSGKNTTPLLQFLFKNVKPTYTVIKKLCTKDVEEIQTVAYLHSIISTGLKVKKILESIAFDLDKLSLAELFKIYNSKFVYEGNVYQQYTCKNFLKEIEQRIKAKASELKPQDVLKIIKDDKEIATGALFYYCTNSFDRHSEMLSYLLTELAIYSNLFSTVDIKNCQGDTLAKFARQQNSYHIVQQLLARGANPDEPDQKGETLLNPIVDFSFLLEREFPAIKAYIQNAGNVSYAVQNSLNYETKRGFGGHEGIKALLTLSEGKIGKLSLQQLIENCQQGHNSDWKIKALLSNLSEKYVDEMVRLVKHERLKNKLAQFELDYYFSRLKDFNPAILQDSNEENLNLEQAKEQSNYKQNSSTLFKPKGQDDEVEKAIVIIPTLNQ